MPKIEFKRKEVAEKYDCNIDKDIIVHTKGYSGKISNINLPGAAHISKDRNTPWIVEKDKIAKPKATDEVTKLKT